MKFLLAKRGDIVYKYSTHFLFLRAMKRFFFPLAVAAVCGFTQAFGTSADFVEAELTLKPSDAKIEQISPRAEYFSSKETSKALSPAWHVLRIPYTLRGKCRGEKKPLFVDELKMHAYLVFAVGKDGDKLILVDKEVTYVDIPLSAKAELSENKNVQAAVFISPSDAVRICADDARKVDKADLSDKLAAVAVEFSFKGTSCNKKDVDVDVIVNKKIKKNLKKGWWKKEDKAGIGVQLRAISETPFAPFYAPAFPATNPLYGDAASTSSSAPSSTGYSPAATTDTGYTPATTTTTTGSDETAAETSATEETPADTKSRKKGKKSRK